MNCFFCNKVHVLSALKRKVSEYEQKTELLKQKSDCYEQLMTKKIKLDKLEEFPSTSLDNTDLNKARFVSPGLTSNGDSRSTSPYPSQDSTETSISHEQENSCDSITGNSQELTA